MGFDIKPNFNRYHPVQLSKGWGIMDATTGELLKKATKHRIERYSVKAWASERCKQLNKED